MTNEHSKFIGSQVARELLRIKAVKLQAKQPFTWASGWKSPIYCDNRLSLSYPAIRTMVKTAFAERILKQFPKVEVIAGVATAGIPQGALVADALNLPFIYVRDKAKSHGMTNLIEGDVQGGKNVVVIEDLISTGGSSIKAVHALRAAHLNVLGLGAIFTYGFPVADKNFGEVDVAYFALSNYSLLLEVAINDGYISKEELESLNAWRTDPSIWKG